MPANFPLTRLLANFVVSLDTKSMPAQVLEKARACLLNGYGMALGSHTTPFAPVARAAVLAMDGRVDVGGATLLGDGRKTTMGGRRWPTVRCFTAEPRKIPAARPTWVRS